MTPERRKEIDKIVTWALVQYSKEEYDEWFNQNLCPEEYLTGRDGILYDWCERCEYLNCVNNCSNENCRLKNEDSNSNE